jgi:hypothetical protein
VEGDEEDGGDMDDLEEEFQMKKPHEPVAFDVYSVSSFFLLLFWFVLRTCFCELGSLAGKRGAAGTEVAHGRPDAVLLHRKR